jgi:hypothetical protein
VKDHGEQQKRDAAEPLDASQVKRRYVTPRLVVYGNVAKLTQSGGISVKDMGSMKRADS